MLHRIKERENLYTILFGILVVIVAGYYSILLSKRTMPFAEGWYTYYAQCINKGEIVYKDFDYLFTPLYIYFISFITKIFGYKIIVLRIVGVFFFCVIAFIVYLILCEIFRESWACIAAITSVFFLQSEVVQVFYDYVRLMDIFACLTVLFLVKAVKQIDALETKKYYMLLLVAGVCNAFFYLVKQNMGLVYAVYALIFVAMANIVLRKPTYRIVKSAILFLDGLIVPVLFTYAIMLCQGSLFTYFKQTGAEAIDAKGGIASILFGWLKNNIQGFQGGMLYAIVVLCIIGLANYLKKFGGGVNALAKKYKEHFLMNSVRRGIALFGWEWVFKGRELDSIYGILFCVIVFLYITMAVFSEKFAKIVEGYSYLSPYSVFLIVFPLFCIFTGYVIYRFIRKRKIKKRGLLYIAVTGSYFAISYGCGMSAGLAEGQATIGVAFTVALLLDSLEFRFSEGIKMFIIFISLFLTLQSAEKKMAFTYNWWGMDESDFWDCQKVSDDIPLLAGIQMSEETLQVYETVYHMVNENTEEGDTMYCFPQIPVFYSICHRFDPGVRAKVQWFDVASDYSIQADKERIKRNPPKVVLIYETSEEAYNSHEKLFRNGKISSTRDMRNFLLYYVQTHGYKFYGRVTSTDNNHILLYYKTDNNYTFRNGFEGQGTYDSPYLIHSAEDLLNLKLHVQHGNDFAGIYFKQTEDLDLGSVGNWCPIGEFESGFYFRGIYDGSGHTISHMRCKMEGNVGLFGQLGGIVCNLGIVDSEVSGSCVGVVASHALDENAVIANCYTDAYVSGVRAGGIADNFCGTIFNCISISEVHGIESAGAISYDDGDVFNVFALQDRVMTGIINNQGNRGVTYCTEVWLESENILALLNEAAADISHCIVHYQKTGNLYDEATDISYESWMQKINLLSWDFTDSQYYPVLQK